MLAIRPPQQMPHATSQDAFPFHPAKYPQRLPDLSGRGLPFPPPTTLTPPLDMNSTVSAGYKGSRARNYDNGLQYPPSSHQHSYQNTYTPAYTVPHEYSRPTSHASSPTSYRRDPASSISTETIKSPSDSVAASLRIPRTISTPQNSLSKLAAEITCLFWFENSTLLKQIEGPRASHLPIQKLAHDAIPSTGFRKWVATILTTTQVTQNVILLALLFIYRLKDINPSVKGKPGSEFRLFTVALMLGNKFLDDNTYTNKTWAEVSGISVQEVHIMEVEFLSNMRYSLFTSEEMWKEWHIKLGKFGTYFDQATRPMDNTPRFSSLLAPTLQMPPALPSPPTSNYASPPYVSTYSPAHPTRSNTPFLLPQIGSTAVSPVGPLPELDPRATARKRSYDEHIEEPAPKRLNVNRSFTHQLPPLQLSSTQAMPSMLAATSQRLPLPNLAIPSYSSGPTPMQMAPQLPPPGGRAMSM
ncbi:hypothetical protein LTS18_008620, partial [Coniosporium uncinatum]